MALILDPSCAVVLLRELGWIITRIAVGVTSEGYSDEGLAVHTEVLCEARCPCVVNWHGGAEQCAAMARWSRNHSEVAHWGPEARWRLESKWGPSSESSGGSYGNPDDLDQLPQLGHAWSHAEAMGAAATATGHVVARRASSVAALSEDLLRVEDSPETATRTLRALALVLRGSRLPGCAEAADRLESP